MQPRFEKIIIFDHEILTAQTAKHLADFKEEGSFTENMTLERL